MSVLPPIASLIVSLQSNINGSKMIAGQSLQLTAIIKVAMVKNASAVATCFINDKNIYLPAIVLTPVKVMLLKSISTVYLAIAPNNLAGGSTLIFSLSCCTSSTYSRDDRIYHCCSEFSTKILISSCSASIRSRTSNEIYFS